MPARLKQDCAVCMTSMQNSRVDISFMRCGHAMHLNCLKEYCKTSIACPFCRKSLCDPKLFESDMDNQLACMPMPEEYADKTMVVACHDCMFKSKVKFHILGGKCEQCGSYNTARIEE